MIKYSSEGTVEGINSPVMYSEMEDGNERLVMS